MDGRAVQLVDNEVILTPAPLSTTHYFTVPLCVSNGSQSVSNKREGPCTHAVFVTRRLKAGSQ